MGKPKVLAVETATPDFYITQKEVCEFYEKNGLIPPAQRDLYRRLLLEGPIKGRYFGLSSPGEIVNEAPDAQIDRFSEQGRLVLARACRAVMKAAGLSPGDIDGLVISTCTGYLCPGLSSYMVEDLSLRNDIKVLDIMGMGCGSAIPNLECGCAMLQNSDADFVICASVEICSATHLIDDDPALTVSNCIFGDGAAAALIGCSGGDKRGILVEDFQTGVFPRYREALRYRNHNGHLRNTLSPRVPSIGARCLETVTCQLLGKHGLNVSDVNWWAVHAGGTAVLEKVEETFGLSSDKLEPSRRIFKEFGNMSSPTVLFVLQQIMNRGLATGPGLVLGFGAGFTAFAALAKGSGAD